jgi:hypothetical protein
MAFCVHCCTAHMASKYGEIVHGHAFSGLSRGASAKGLVTDGHSVSIRGTNRAAFQEGIGTSPFRALARRGFALLGAVAMVACFGATLGGCAEGDGEDLDHDRAPVDSVRGTISSTNRLALNRLALNRLALNRLALNRLALNQLSGMRWGLPSTNELLADANGREVLKYVVQCAMEAGDVMVGTVNGVTYEFPGLLGLVPRWKYRSLTDTEQRLLSACLLAHVNAFGVPISISVRARNVLYATEEERREYPVYEGTFFGHVLNGDMTHAYSCQGSDIEVASAHSEDREMRACTDGNASCGIVSVGRCRDVCMTRTEDAGWTDCWADGRLYRSTISVYLFADDAYGLNRSCTGSRCNLQTGQGAAAILDCNGSRDCDATCTDGATCSVDAVKSRHVDVEIRGANAAEIDCYDGEDCAVECTDGSSCDVECQRGEDCNIQCKGGASCDVDCYRGQDCAVDCAEGSTCNVTCGGWGRSCEEAKCRGGSTCNFECRDSGFCNFARCEAGAACLLECKNAWNCNFAYCPGGATQCGNGVVACGRPCP